MSDVIQLKKDTKALKYIIPGVILLIILYKSIVVVPPGHVGIQVLFGKVRDVALPEGLHFINPFLQVKKMSVRTQQITEKAVAPSKEGANITLDVTLLFSLKPEKAPQVFKTVGSEYVGIVVEPTFRSVIRGATASFEAEALYTSAREKIAKKMSVDIAPALESRGVNFENILLRKILLPEMVSVAIDRKLEEKQNAQKMEFTLLRERKEADRKKIEADGIANFQRIVSKGLTDSFLRWKGIEATQRLAESNNAKVVVIGSGKDGLPIILGGEHHSSAPISESLDRPSR